MIEPWRITPPSRLVFLRVNEGRIPAWNNSRLCVCVCVCEGKRTKENKRVEHFLLLGSYKGSASRPGGRGVGGWGGLFQRKHINPKAQMTRSKVILFSIARCFPFFLARSQSRDEPRTKPSDEFLPPSFRRVAGRILMPLLPAPRETKASLREEILASRKQAERASSFRAIFCDVFRD